MSNVFFIVSFDWFKLFIASDIAFVSDDKFVDTVFVFIRGLDILVDTVFVNESF